MPRKMSGICAIWLVRFLRLKRKDGLSGTTGRSALDWGPNRNSPRTPGFWSLGWGWVTGTHGGGSSALAQSILGRGTQPDLVELQPCPLRDTAVPSRASEWGALGFLCWADHRGVPSPTCQAKPTRDKWNGEGLEVENHPVRQLTGVPSATQDGKQDRRLQKYPYWQEG